jgi:hypothetical protein
MKKTYLLALLGLFNTCVGVQAADISVAAESAHRSCAASSAIGIEDDVVIRAVETFRAETIDLVSAERAKATQNLKRLLKKLTEKLVSFNIAPGNIKLFLTKIRTYNLEKLVKDPCAINFRVSAEEAACIHLYLKALLDAENENKALYKMVDSLTTDAIDLSAARKWLASDLYLRVARLEGYLRARKSG